MASAQTPLVCGQTIHAEIGEVGEQDLYTFAGTAGDTVWLSLADTQDLDAGLTAQGTVLRPTTGAALTTVTNALAQVTLPETGTYTVRVWDDSFPHDHAKRGSYRLHLEWTWPTNRPCLATWPSSGPQGQAFDVWGSGYTPNSAVTRHERQPDSGEVTLPPLTADAGGRLAWQSVTTCATAVGIHELWAVDQTSSRPSNSVNQTVTPGDCQTVTVTKVGSGNGTVFSLPPGIDCGSDCSESYGHGTTVTLTAVAAPGSTFAGWSGEGCTGTGTCTVAMVAGQVVTATFTLNAHGNRTTNPILTDRE